MLAERLPGLSTTPQIHPIHLELSTSSLMPRKRHLVQDIVRIALVNSLHNIPVLRMGENLDAHRWKRYVQTDVVGQSFASAATRRVEHANLSASLWPTASITTSAPRFSVAAMMALWGSEFKFNGFAPCFSAIFNRDVFESIAYRCLAPSVRATIIAERPTCHYRKSKGHNTGPHPTTTIVSVSRRSGDRSFKALVAAYHL